MTRTITYFAHAATDGTLRSVEAAVETIDLFGHLCIPLHYAWAKNKRHKEAYEIAKEAYARRPHAHPPALAHKLFDKNLPIAIDTDEDQDYRIYAAYLHRCRGNVRADFGISIITLVDHPDILVKPHSLSYGTDIRYDSLIDDRYWTILPEFEDSRYAFEFGYPFWRSTTNHNWLEFPSDLGYSHATYTAKDPQPTIEQQRERFHELHSIAKDVKYGVRNTCMFFSLRDQDPIETARLHRDNPDAQAIDVLCLWPQPGEGSQYTPVEKVRAYLEEMNA